MVMMTVDTYPIMRFQQISLAVLRFLIFNNISFCCS